MDMFKSLHAATNTNTNTLMHTHSHTYSQHNYTFVCNFVVFVRVNERENGQQICVSFSQHTTHHTLKNNTEN